MFNNLLERLKHFFCNLKKENAKVTSKEGLQIQQSLHDLKERRKTVYFLPINSVFNTD